MAFHSMLSEKLLSININLLRPIATMSLQAALDRLCLGRPPWHATPRQKTLRQAKPMHLMHECYRGFPPHADFGTTNTKISQLRIHKPIIAVVGPTIVNHEMLGNLQN